MSFWRTEVIQPALDAETRRQMQEQAAWLEREPGNPRPYYHLAEFFRMEGRREEALGLLLEAVRLDPDYAAAHAALAQCYAVRGDYTAAWRHARRADHGGDKGAVELLTRYGIGE